MQIRQKSAAIGVPSSEAQRVTDQKVINVSFKKDGYDPFIDFLKGVCIACVVLTHCLTGHSMKSTLFPFWGTPAVPIFLLIQVFHAYKRGFDNVSLSWTKLWNRIIKPFVIIESIIFCVHIGNYLIHDWSIVSAIKDFIKSGGLGPGSYYMWLYIQFAILLAFLAPLFKKYNSAVLLIIFILVSQLLEVFCCVASMPSYLYRILFFRYLLIIYLGSVVVKSGIQLNKKTIFVALISMGCVFVFEYLGSDLQPLFYREWRRAHWTHYFYFFYLVLPFFYWVYLKLKNYTGITSFVMFAGKYSYEIYVFQLLYFFVTKLFVNLTALPFAWKVVYMLVSMFVCIVPVVWVKQRMRKNA